MRQKGSKLIPRLTLWSVLPLCFGGLGDESDLAGSAPSGAVLAVRAAAKGLAEEFDRLAPWDTKERYTKDAWVKATSVAVIVQQTQPEVVEEACRVFVDAAEGDYGEMTKLFIVMRLVFDLPEEAPIEHGFSYAALVRRGRDVVKTGYVNLAWPLTFGGGQPSLTHDYLGAEGPPYAAADEYRYLLSKYKFRRLSGGQRAQPARSEGSDK